MVEIKQQLVSSEVQQRVTFPGTNGRKYMVVHQTGNPRRGANAQMHANLQSNGNSRQASWMIQSDDKEIIQSFPFTARTWHAGDGRGPGNFDGISWEICINEDADYLKTLEVAAAGIAYLLKQHNLTVSDMRQHWDFSRKNCPAQIRAGVAGVTWNEFKAMVQAEMEDKPAPKPSPQPKPSKPAQSVYTGNSIVSYLNSIGQPSSFSARAELAKDKGIPNYRGTAEQNLRLLNMLRSEGNAQAVEPSTAPNPEPKLTARQVAEQIYRGQGDWGNNPGRKQKVIERGYSWSEVQGIVNQLVRGQSAAKPKKSVDEVAREILYSRNYGGWGTGETRRKRLREAGYDPAEVQRRVNQLAR